MNAFGVRFAVNDPEQFEALRSLYSEIKRDQDAGRFRDPAEWERLVPDLVKARFHWPTAEERSQWLRFRNTVIISIPDPSQQLSATWDFFRVFEAIEESEYDVLDCVLDEQGRGELQIDPQAYPYGGVGPLIALAEAYGFTVLGVNEYGKYQSREELLAERR